MKRIFLLLILLLSLLWLTGCDGQDTPQAQPEADAPSSGQNAGVSVDLTGGANLPQEGQESPPPEEEPARAPWVSEEVPELPDLGGDALMEQLGAVLTVDGVGYEYYNFHLASADRYIAAVSKAGEDLKDIAQTYVLVAPNSMGVCLPDDLQQEAGSSDQQAATDYLYGSMANEVTPVPVFKALRESFLAGDELYFRTDHHWTALGAYRAYEQFCQTAGVTAAPLDTFEAHSYEGFLGSFYNSTQSKAMKEKPDTLVTYRSPATNTIYITTKTEKDWKYLVVGNVEHTAASEKYTAFIGGDNPFSRIHNPEKEDGSAILLVKESYGNAFAPFLIESYEDVYIADYRYYHEAEDRSLTQLCQELDIGTVLFLNNISATRSENLVAALEGFVGQ